MRMPSTAWWRQYTIAFAVSTALLGAAMMAFGVGWRLAEGGPVPSPSGSPGFGGVPASVHQTVQVTPPPVASAAPEQTGPPGKPPKPPKRPPHRTRQPKPTATPTVAPSTSPAPETAPPAVQPTPEPTVSTEFPTPSPS